MDGHKLYAQQDNKFMVQEMQEYKEQKKIRSVQQYTNKTKKLSNKAGATTT